MPDGLDAMLLRLRAQHSEPARRKWTSGLERRHPEKDNERDDDEPHTKTIKYGCTDGAGGNEWDGSGAGRGAGTAPDADGTEAHAVIQGCSRRRCASGRTPMMIDRGTVCACVEVPL